MERLKRPARHSVDQQSDEGTPDGQLSGVDVARTQELRLPQFQDGALVVGDGQAEQALADREPVVADRGGW